MDFHHVIVKYFELFNLAENEDIQDDFTFVTHFSGQPEKTLNLNCNGLETCVFRMEKGKTIAHFSTIQGANFTKFNLVKAEKPIILIFLDSWQDRFRGSFNFNTSTLYSYGDWMTIDQNMQHFICFCSFESCLQPNNCCKSNMSVMELAVIIQKQLEKEGKKVKFYPDLKIN